MRIGRRPVFFAIVAVVCLVLVPVTPAEYRWLNLALALLAGFWAVMLAIEDLSQSRRARGGDARP